ncbi:N-acetylmannosamine-6-phosphate 2-epimerase [Pseudalkalibacillus salsuginis]|uniref:N-acetylmannosamine-6-phosphate 2-epimerase n=1 Tax=Pseudalkalibacillus salsuginis TaxID=2910972 RepID=UPI001F413E3C|nr:N-acetylmannosamine-6-phosphate 2-epimerase [Pseudalkalibacillus salsuginis]MCF6411571.1 N-acetylmannosamine-6-phosphate 2-epimerase [Pseudalkalibacillus salsuginis]
MEPLTVFQQLKGGLIVSCQALEDEPLHGSEMMAKMAKAAQIGGAVGIRANGTEDILEIKKLINLPIIGLVKKSYPDSEIYITPTCDEVEELIRVDVDIIAIDSTMRERPRGQEIEQLIKLIHSHKKLVMADVSTYEEGVRAAAVGADCISTTLSGYTTYSPPLKGPDFQLVERLAKRFAIPVFAEGKYHSPEDARQALRLGAHCVVVGSAITRPQEITRRYTDFIKKEGNADDSETGESDRKYKRVD